MRATDIARRYIVRCDQMVDLTGRLDFAKNVLSLSPTEVAKLEIVDVTASVDADAWAPETFVLCVMDSDDVAANNQAVYRVLEQRRTGVTCMVMLPRQEWFLRFLLEPMTREGWTAETLVHINNKDFECALITARSTADPQKLLRVRNEYVYLQLAAEQREACVVDLERRAEHHAAERRTTEQRAVEQRAVEQRAAEHSAAELRQKIIQLQAAVAKTNRQCEVVADRLDKALGRIEVLTERETKARRNVQMVRESGRFRFGDAFFQIYKRPLDLAQRVWKGRGDASPPVPPPAKAPVPVAVPSPRREPVITLSRPKSPTALSKLRVAAILDDMSEQCFAPECELIQFTPNNYQEELQHRPPHFLLVESAWKGNGGSWQYKVGRYNHPDAGGLSELLQWCNRQSIPTVFWNKEDPVHFDKFKHAAAQFDVVFTTDEHAIGRYEDLPDSGISRFGALPFAAQPRLHNPVFAGERALEPCFAGSYYGNRHGDRRAQQEMLLDAAREHGVVIYDRNFGSEAPEFRFPERFRSHIKGRLEYVELSRVYKQHRIFLNVNSVIDSPTMMSRRVYELLASGTAVVSTPSQAIAEIFGARVSSVTSEEEARDALRILTADRALWTERSRDAVRFVMANHTYADRLRTIADALDLCPGQTGKPSLTVAVVVSSPAAIKPLLSWLDSQIDAPITEILVGTHDGDTVGALREAVISADPKAARARVVLLDADGMGAYRELAALATQQWVLIAAGRLWEDPHLLQDLALATQFSKATLIGTSGATEGGASAEQAYVDRLEPSTVLIDKALLERVGWPQGDADDHIQALRREGAQLYSVREQSHSLSSAGR